MLGIKQLRLVSTHPRVAQPHRYAPRIRHRSDLTAHQACAYSSGRFMYETNVMLTHP